MSDDLQRIIKGQRTVWRGRSVGGAAPSASLRVTLEDGRTVTAKAYREVRPGESVSVVKGVNGGGFIAISHQSASTSYDREIDNRRNKRDDEDEKPPDAAIVYVVGVERYIPAARVAVIYSIVQEAEEPIPFACPRYDFGVQRDPNGLALFDGEAVCFPTADADAPYATFRECADANPYWTCTREDTPPPDGSVEVGGGCTPTGGAFYRQYNNLPSDARSTLDRKISAYKASSSSSGSGGTGQYKSITRSPTPPQPAETIVVTNQDLSSISVSYWEEQYLINSSFNPAAMDIVYFSDPSGRLYSALFRGSSAVYGRDAGISGYAPVMFGMERIIPTFPISTSIGSAGVGGATRYRDAIPGYQDGQCRPYYVHLGDVIDNFSAFEQVESVPFEQIVPGGGDIPVYYGYSVPTDPWDSGAPRKFVLGGRASGFGSVPSNPPPGAGGYTPPPVGTVPPNCKKEDPYEGEPSRVRRKFFVGGHEQEPVELEIEVNGDEEVEAFVTYGESGFRAYVKYGKKDGKWCKVERFGSMRGTDWQRVYARDKNDPSASGSGYIAAYKAQDANVDTNLGDQVLEIDRTQVVRASSSLANKNQPLEDELKSFIRGEPGDLTEADEQIPATVVITPIISSSELGAPYNFPTSIYRIAYESLMFVDQNDQTELPEDDIIYINGCPYVPIVIHQISPFRLTGD